ncbi:MAG: Rrf2 family transcriptional regulator [Caulobacterales bacterium]
MLTAKAKYALRALIELAKEEEARGGRPVMTSRIAERQNIPRRFLENILLDLSKQELVVSFRGKAGGYRLARSADLISFADIIRAIDGPLALTPCTSRIAYQRCADCTDETVCSIRKTMIRVRNATADILQATTLADALNETP